jgi:hypothetical protein
MADQKEILRILERAGKSLLAELWTAADQEMLRRAAANWIELNEKAERAPDDVERTQLQGAAREVLDNIDLAVRAKLLVTESVFIKEVLPDLIQSLPRLFSRLIWWTVR